MFLDLAEQPRAATKTRILISPQEQCLDFLQRLEADVAQANLIEMQEIEKLHPDWFDLYEATPVDTSDSEELQALLASAPTAYAKGLVIGALKVRLEIAAVTGRAF